jgi:hypothetical protein
MEAEVLSAIELFRRVVGEQRNALLSNGYSFDEANKIMCRYQETDYFAVVWALLGLQRRFSCES